ncbi:hypothetical protein [Carnobacterium antarcticum]|uniref:Uncharacterized protein n=1 Tax=Carnobacterium antarcticum TaxID=2126436 RepID=A0ABW4NLT5_9LACT|nr:hypothetical protein [Carnobacterium sp. CP1]ALV21027.1 hypothetical protein NY10_407 [Carnobacterium sp. CP1]
MSKKSNFKLSGFEDMSKKLNDLSKKANNANGEHSVPFEELFSSSFMNKYTNGDEIYSFFIAGGFDASNNESFEAIDENQLDVYISDNSSFQSWQDMKNSAAEQYTLKILGF